MEAHLTLKHLSAYLPYGLKCQYIGIINGAEISAYQKQFVIDNKDKYNWLNYKPIEPIEGMKIGYLKSIHSYKNYYNARCGIKNNGLKNFCNGYGLKPILYPLGYLTKPITHNEETFVPIDNLEKGENGSIYSEYSSDGNKTETISITYKIMGDTFTDFIINRNSIDNTDYKYVQKLIEWKFDVFSLIENNLAIAVTETFNPYEK